MTLAPQQFQEFPRSSWPIHPTKASRSIAVKHTVRNGVCAQCVYVSTVRFQGPTLFPRHDTCDCHICDTATGVVKRGVFVGRRIWESSPWRLFGATTSLRFDRTARDDRTFRSSCFHRARELIFVCEDRPFQGPKARGPPARPPL